MAYGLKYQNQFNSRSQDGEVQRSYTLQFLFKDYTDGAISVFGGDTSVIQRCTLDDPTAPIKGQSLDITLVNDNNSLPITFFQSEDDDGVIVKLLEGANVLFIGFLVQDDFYETMVDFTHTITLSANDSLGLLKGVILSEANVRRPFTAQYRTASPLLGIYIKLLDTAFYPVIGNIIEIEGITYTITNAFNINTIISGITYNWNLFVTPTAGTIAPNTGTIYLTGELNLLNRNSILSLIAVCLAQTNLSLITNIFHNLYEYRQDPAISTLVQTQISSQIFINGDTYDNCYEALSKLLTAFKLTLFQANGQWNIVHWYETVQHSAQQVPGFIFDETFTYIGPTVLNNNFFIGPTQPSTWLTGLTAGAVRGIKFSKKTFNYRQPKYLLRNFDLLETGDLIRTYISGPNTISEYVATSWTTGTGPTLATRFIRVVVDTGTNTEVERYLVITGACSDQPEAVGSVPFEMQKNDRITFSFTVRTNISQGGPRTEVFSVKLYDGTNTRYVDNDRQWKSTRNFAVNIPSGSNTSNALTVDMPSDGAPFQGLCTVYLGQITDTPQSGAKETHYKDIRLEYTPYINDSVKITGQIHSQSQAVNKKKNEDVEIFIDDSPRNSIAGTLFLTTFTGLLQDRTDKWRFVLPIAVGGLNQENTFEDLWIKQCTRTRLEGTFYGNSQAGIPVSLLTVLIPDFSPTKIFIFGLLTIDYKRNQFSGTLYEINDTAVGGLTPAYTFVYKYSST